MTGERLARTMEGEKRSHLGGLASGLGPPQRAGAAGLRGAVAVAAGVFGADACAAAAESRETASDARRSLAPPSRSPATAGRCTHRPTPIAFLAFLHTPLHCSRGRRFNSIRSC